MKVGVFRHGKSINDSLKQGMITAYQPDYPGKIMIATGLREQYEGYQNQWSSGIILLFFAVLLLLTLYFYYIRRTILHPFQKLTAFAGEIAEGRLDVPLPMDRHNIFGVFTESFDLMRTSLKEARYREMQANRSKKEMVASLSHDIKTPVTIIRLHLDFLRMQVKDEKQLEKLDAMASKTDQIDYLINNLLQSTLEELGHLKVNPTHEDSRILPDILKAVHIREDLHIQPIPPCLISIDRKRIEQVISNILYNAEKYAGTPVDIDFTMADPFLQMDISDQGGGVPETEIEYLCEKFYRGKAALESGKEGEGLGLYISSYLMNKMNGELICINKPDGFTVRLLLPLSL